MGEYDKNHIAKILVERDGVPIDEAWDTIEATQEDINLIIDNGGSILDIEDIIYTNLALEPDYLMAFLNI